MSGLSPAERQLRKLVRDYQSLNGSQVDELSAAPTPLEFSRFVAANRPVVVRGAGEIAALDRWTDAYLIERLGQREVNISVSPKGNADSIVGGLFAEPANVPMPLSRLFSHLKAEEGDTNSESTSPVYYLQSQNGNLAEEYSALREDVGDEGPEWAREVFGEPPDVANIWIGGRRSKTSMHKDPYENIYCVVRGTKTFTLLPPTEAYCVHEPEVLVPWIPVDPLNPDFEAFPRYKLARPMQVTLEKGDMLYLPALWFHLVEQDVGWGPSGPGIGTQAAIAVNWWYDMNYGAPTWSLLQFVRRKVLELDGREDPAEESEGEE
ncbi:hypothetical protein JCM10213v2_002999 [Rhodosporidiobolus nylandii]